MQSVTDAALANLDVEELLHELLLRVTDALETDTAAILLLDRERNELVARAAKGIEEEVEQNVRIPLGKGFAGSVAVKREPVILQEVTRHNVFNPILIEKGITSLLGVPLIVQAELIGVLHVGTLTPRTFTSSDVELLQLVADRVAMAIHVGLYERERMLTASLQDAFMPAELPEVAEVQLVGRYVPASGNAVGGDWYDAFPLPDGTIALAVGDVVGHGLHAAAVMARLRNALRAYAVHGLRPEEVVEALNAMVLSLDAGEMATLIYGVLDPQRRSLTLVNAGHPPPVLASTSGAILLETPRRPPLGTHPSATTNSYTLSLERGCMLLLYSDGLVERRTTSLTEELEALRSCVETTPFEDLPRVLLRAVEGVKDDVAFLAARLPADPSALYRIVVPAHADQLARVRNMLRRWLDGASVSADLSYDALVATGEACANAIEHAYGSEAGTIEVTLVREGDRLVARVKDGGRWRSSAHRGRGRGLSMMSKLSAHVDVRATVDGTEVLLEWELPSR